MARGGPRRPAAPRTRRAQRPRPLAGRRRRLRVHDDRRRAGHERRAQRRARRGLSRHRPRHHRRPAVRLRPAGGPFRRPGGDVGRDGGGDRGRGRGDEPGADRRDHRPRTGRALRPDGDRSVRLHPPGALRRGDRPQVGDRPRGDGPLRRLLAPACGPGDRRRSFRRGDRPARDQAGSCREQGRDSRHRRGRPCGGGTALLRRRGAAGLELREALLPSSGLRGGRPGHGRHLVADLGRVGGRAHHVRGACDRARTPAAGALPHLRGRGQRPGHHAHRTDPRDDARPREGEALTRRHRPGRDQRGVRLGRARLGEGAPPRHGEGQRERWRDRHRTPDRRLGGPPPRHPGATRWSGRVLATASRPCARAAGRPTRPSSSGSGSRPPTCRPARGRLSRSRSSARRSRRTRLRSGDG